MHHRRKTPRLAARGAIWSNGGSTGASQGTITVRNYREDVTKFLAVATRDP
jgi:hypothetical protein